MYIRLHSSGLASKLCNSFSDCLYIVITKSVKALSFFHSGCRSLSG